MSETEKLLPPVKRSSIWRSISDAAGRDEFILQRCGQCQTVQYPPREICRDCLADDLHWQLMSGKGELISHTQLHASSNAFFREHLPQQIALVKLECGPILFAHLACKEVDKGDRITVISKRDLSGEAVFIALLDKADKDQQLIELGYLLEAGVDNKLTGE